MDVDEGDDASTAGFKDVIAFSHYSVPWFFCHTSRAKAHLVCHSQVRLLRHPRGAGGDGKCLTLYDCFVLFNSFHTKTDSALLVYFKHLDLDHLPF